MASALDDEAADGGVVRPRRRVLRRVAIGLLGLLLFVVGLFGSAAWRISQLFLHTTPAPESSTGLRGVVEIHMPHSIVVAAHPEAVRIGQAVLAAGGSAADAAVAVQAALTLVEPQSSGIGGGAFMLYYDARQQALRAYDGRETAPAAATPTLLVDEAGKALPFPAALVGGRSVGVPGVVRLLSLVHERHGRLKWAQLWGGAAMLAEQGFVVTPRLHALIEMDPILPTLPSARDYFFGADGWALRVGSTRRNVPLAETLRRIGRDGPDAFYGGDIARDIVDAVQAGRRPSLVRMGANLLLRQLGVAAMGSATTPSVGGLALSDLAAYRAKERAPLCVPYRRYRVCGFPPPSSGGIAVLQALRLLERFDLSHLSPNSDAALHLLLEAERLAYADRDAWGADPDFVSVPVSGLLDEEYLKTRSATIRSERSMGVARAGQPFGAPSSQPAKAAEVPSTTHFVIVDSDGNIACASSSIEYAFGAHVFVRGFLLNNQLTDFSFVPSRKGQPVANAVAPGKRPRSSMAPILVFDAATGKPLVALGSPGGGRIIGYVLRALTGMLDFGLTPQQAVALPHVLNMNGDTEVEDVGWATENDRQMLVKGLSARGHKVAVGQANSGLHVVKLTPQGLLAGIDPRREGAAAGN